MIFYKNTIAKVCLRKCDTDFLDNVTGVLKGNALEPNMFIIYLDYVLWMSIDLIKENIFAFKKSQELDDIQQHLW